MTGTRPVVDVAGGELGFLPVFFIGGHGTFCEVGSGSKWSVVSRISEQVKLISICVAGELADRSGRPR